MFTNASDGSEATRLALVLDDLRHLNVTQNEVDEVARELFGTAHVDQLKAAGAELLRHLDGRHDLSYTDPAEWIRLGATMAFSSYATGQGRTCLHSPRPSRPAPVFAAAWHPDLAVCGRCRHLLAAPRGTTYRCDRCGVDSEPGRFRVNQLLLGHFAWEYGVCDDCDESVTEVTA